MRRATHGDDGTPDESPERAHCSDGDGEFADVEEELHDIGSFTCEEENREEEGRREDVHVPRKGECASVDSLQTFLDDDGVEGGDCRGGDAEENTEAGYGGAIEEYANEEAKGDDSAGGEDFHGGAGVQEDCGDDHGEGEDEAAGDLVEGGVDVFESVVAEAVDG